MDNRAIGPLNGELYNYQLPSLSGGYGGSWIIELSECLLVYCIITSCLVSGEDMEDHGTIEL
jgi:hypothetical protein